MRTYVNILGNKYGKLTVIEFSHIEQSRRYACWKCLCECGNKLIAQGHLLRKGTIKSCGCLKRNKQNKNRCWKGYEEISMKYFGSLKLGAIHRNIEFNISIEYLWELFLKQEKRCRYSNLPLIFALSCRSWDGSASLDRIDNSKGYIEGNVQWIHKDINKMKMNLTERRFFHLINLIYEHSGKI